MILDDETVQGEMLGLERERPVHVREPAPFQGAGQAEDEVQRQHADPRASQCVDRGIDLRGGVGAVGAWWVGVNTLGAQLLKLDQALALLVGHV